MDDPGPPVFLERVFTQHLYSFVLCALCGWTCLEGLRRACASLAGATGVAAPTFTSIVSPMTGTMRYMREFRNKAVAHVALFEPRDESVLTRAAYVHPDYGVRTGEERSSQRPLAACAPLNARGSVDPRPERSLGRHSTGSSQSSACPGEDTVDTALIAADLRRAQNRWGVTPG
jgi:hypothetical protein